MRKIIQWIITAVTFSITAFFFVVWFYNVPPDNSKSAVIYFYPEKNSVNKYDFKGGKKEEKKNDMNNVISVFKRHNLFTQGHIIPQDIHSLALELELNKTIKNRSLLILLLKFYNIQNTVTPGEYLVPSNTSCRNICKILTRPGGLVTIPVLPGNNLKEIAETFRQKVNCTFGTEYVSGEVMRLFMTDKSFDFFSDDYGFTPDSPAGYILPGLYTLVPDSDTLSLDDIVTQFLNTAANQFAVRIAVPARSAGKAEKIPSAISAASPHNDGCSGNYKACFPIDIFLSFK